jgi:pimeloyl-[acyl-carrier protein] methyl ester esterase
MHIETRGHGPDLVLIHGWAMHGGIFAPLTERLAGAFRLHLVDLPGHGLSRADAGGLDPLRCAARIADATPPALWLGWSLGGLVAIAAALGHPRQVRALVTVATNPRFVTAPDWPSGVDRSVFENFAAGLETDYRHAVLRFLALEAHGSAHAQAELRALKAQVFERGEPAVGALRQGLAVLEDADWRDALPRLAQPSLWVAGRRDRLVPVAAVRHAVAAAPGASLLELDAGHAPFLGHPAAMADAIAALAGRMVLS